MMNIAESIKHKREEMAWDMSRPFAILPVPKLVAVAAFLAKYVEVGSRKV